MVAAAVDQRQPLDDAIAVVLAGLRPEVAEALRACAVPHWFDQGLIAALRGQAAHSDKILARLLRLTFVSAVGPGRFALHDNVRGRLLAEWRHTPDHLRALHQRALAEFERRRHAGQADGVLDREAAYHLLALDRRAGLRAVAALFDEAEAQYVPAAAELLVKLLREPGDPALAAWADFYAGRLAGMVGDVATAQSLLEPLVAQPAGDESLRAEAHLALGKVMVRGGHYLQAIEHYRYCLDYFRRIDEPARAGRVMVEIGSAYADFAISVQPMNRLRYRVASRSQAWASLGALLEFGLTLLANLVLLLPIVVYLAWRSPRHSIGSIALADVSLFNPAGAMLQVLLMVLVGRAVGWYGQAERSLTSARARSDLQLRQAGLLLRFNHPIGALRRFRYLAANLPDPAGSYRHAILQRELARCELVFGWVATALERLEQALSTLRRSGDRRAEAETLALLGHARLLQAGPGAALDAYRESIALYRQIGDRLGLGQVVLEIEQLQGRRDLPGARQATTMVDALGIGEDERVYFSRPARAPAGLLLSYLAGPALVLLLFPCCLFVVDVLAKNTAWVWLLTLLLLPLTAWVGLTGVLAAAPGHLLRLLEAQRPGLVLPSADGLAWVGLDGRVERSVRWAEVTGVRSREVSVFGRLQPSRSGLTLFAGEGAALHISGFTTDYRRLRQLVLRRVGERPPQTVAWQVSHDDFGLTAAPLVWLGRVAVWLVLTFGCLVSLAFSLGLAGAADYSFGLAAFVLAAGGAAVYVWGLAWLAREQASHPRWPLAELLLAAGLAYMGLFFVPRWRFAVGGWGMLLLFAIGLTWVLAAGAWMLRPRYLVRQPRLPRWLLLRRQPVLAAGLMAVCLLVALKLVLVDARGYLHQALAQLGATFSASAEYRIGQLRSAARLIPTEPGPHTDLYLAYLETGDRSAAQAVLPQALNMIQRSRSAEYGRRLCWQGALAGEAASVLPACDVAVAVNRYNVEESGQRTVARALSGDLAGAAADLRYIVDRYGFTLSAERIALYEGWAAELEAGRNPFDAATLAQVSASEWSWAEYPTPETPTPASAP